MSMYPTIESIYDRLKQAQKETCVVLAIEGNPKLVEMEGTHPPESCRKGRQDMDRFIDAGTWQTAGPGFQQLREWVESTGTRRTKKRHRTALLPREMIGDYNERTNSTLYRHPEVDRSGQALRTGESRKLRRRIRRTNSQNME